MQLKYATELAFRSKATLDPLYEELIRETVLSVKDEQIARFLGRQIRTLLAQEIGSQFDEGVEGTGEKHRCGKCEIKNYDECGVVLCMETGSNDVSFCEHQRRVEGRQSRGERGSRRCYGEDL